MLKPKRADRLIHCLICWGCHGRMGPNHYTLMDGGAVCNICGSANPLGNLRKVTMLDHRATRDMGALDSQRDRCSRTQPRRQDFPGTVDHVQFR
jgi:hypothetical protein